MAAQEIDVRKRIAATPSSVFRLIGDSSTWPEWTPVDSFEPIEPGGVDGVGEVRQFRTGRVRVRERIVERIPDSHLTYELLSGLAVKEYRAVIDVEPVPGGCEVRWHTTFKPKFIGTGWIYRRALHRVTERFLEGLAGGTEGAEPAREA